MQLKKKGVVLDDVGIISFFFTNDKILSMSIDIVDNKISTDMLHQAHADYAEIVHKIIDTINDRVLSTKTVDCGLIDNPKAYYTAVEEISVFCSNEL